MKAHRTDRVSLIFGLLFLAVAAWWLVGRLVDLPLPAGGWFVAGALILLGLLGVVGALRSAHAPEVAGPSAVPWSGDPTAVPVTDPVAGPGATDPAVEPVTAPPATGPSD